MFNKKIKDIEENKEDLLEECKEYLKNEEKDILSRVERGVARRDVIDSVIKRFLKKRASDEEIKTILSRLKDDLWGYAIIRDLIEDDDISDIKIISEDIVRIKEKGKRKTSGVKFEDAEAVNKFINKVAMQNKVNVADVNALTTFMDKDSSDKFRLRITVATKFVSAKKNGYLHIRKIPKCKKTLQQLIQDGLLTMEQFLYLKQCILNKDIIVFTGKGASGKTTMMNLLLDIVPDDRSGLVIQENEELFSEHPDMMFLNVVTARGEGRINFGLKDLSIHGLLMDLDLYVVGEIKDDSAIYFLNAAYTGHAAMCSSHGESAESAINKLIDYMKYGSDYSRQDLMIMLKDLRVKVVFMKDYNCKDIAELVDYDKLTDSLVYKPICKNSEFIKDVS